MPISPVGGAGGVSMAQLAQAYRQQALAGSQAAQAAQAAQAGQSALTSGAVDAGTAARSADFASAIGKGLQEVGNLDQTAATKAVRAATGDLTDVHDYVIAATQAQTATELTTTVRNKALDAFNEIMRMPL